MHASIAGSSLIEMFTVYLSHAVGLLFLKLNVILWIKLLFVSIGLMVKRQLKVFKFFLKDHDVHKILCLNSENHQDKYLKKKNEICYYWQITISVSKYGDWFYN